MGFGWARRERQQPVVDVLEDIDEPNCKAGFDAWSVVQGDEDLFASAEPDTTKVESEIPEETGHKTEAPAPLTGDAKRRSDQAFLNAVTSMEKED